MHNHNLQVDLKLQVAVKCDITTCSHMWYHNLQAGVHSRPWVRCEVTFWNEMWKHGLQFHAISQLGFRCGIAVLIQLWNRNIDFHAQSQLGLDVESQFRVTYEFIVVWSCVLKSPLGVTCKITALSYIWNRTFELDEQSQIWGGCEITTLSLKSQVVIRWRITVWSQKWNHSLELVVEPQLWLIGRTSLRLHVHDS